MEKDQESNRNILKATSIVGGAQIVTILITIVKTKFVAILLGPAGVGINGILQTTIDLLRQATSFGINFSGVKEIAEASSTGDESRIARVITILRKWSFYTGLLGMLITLLLCYPLSYYSFDSSNYAYSIAIVSITLLAGSITNGQLALLQGLRKIGQMAKVTIISSFIGLAIALPLYWWLGKDGIVPCIVLTSLSGLLVSWIFAKKIKIKTPALTVKETFNGGLNMAYLGFFIVITGVVVTATMYGIRAIVARESGIAAVGCFYAVWTISNTYIGIILNAMLADYFPRLSEIQNDDLKANKMINEQLDLALVIAGPLLVLLIAMAEVVIRVLFTKAFLMAVPVLQWQLLGGLPAIVSWTLGVMFLSKNKGIYSLISETIWSISYFLLVYFGWHYFGFTILGIGYVIAGIIKLILVFFITKNLGNYTPDLKAAKSLLIYSSLIISVFINVMYFNDIFQYIISFILSLISLTISYNRISKIFNIIDFVKNKFKR